MSDERFAAYLSTSIVDHDGRIWAGPGALAELPVPAPVHVITAHNPGTEVLSDADNLARNQELASAVNELNPTSVVEVIGRADTGNPPWEEASLAVTGIAEADIARLAERFGQWAYFELTDTEQRVVAVETLVQHHGAMRPRRS